jgi:hypothetical protein
MTQTYRVCRLSIIFPYFKNAIAFYNAGDVDANAKVVGLAPGLQLIMDLLHTLRADLKLNIGNLKLRTNT